MSTALLTPVFGPEELYSTFSGGAPSYDAQAMSSAGFKAASVMQLLCSGASDTITHVGYRQVSGAGTPAANSMKVSIQTVSTSDGNPTGTDMGSTATDFTPSTANNNKWVWVALGTPLSINRDTALAAVVETSSGWTASNYIGVCASWGIGRSYLPYGEKYAGSWVKNTTQLPSIALKSASAVYGYPSSAIASTQLYGNTVERGMLFTLPTQFGATYKVLGFRASVYTGSGGARDSIATIYDSPLGTPSALQATNQIDIDITVTSSSDYRVFVGAFTGTLATLNTGTTYALGLATTTANDGKIYTLDTESAGDMDGWRFGQQTSLTSRTNASYPPGSSSVSFSAGTTTSRPWIELILDDLTPPSAGGGLAANSVAGFVS